LLATSKLKVPSSNIVDKKEGTPIAIANNKQVQL
jgi:hypothetical protein